ncbi:MAG: hypothetical protein ACSLFH_01100 [Desulfuromonadales bacterium]
MLNRIFLYATIIGAVYLYYTTPTIEDHKAVLLTALQQEYPIPVSMQERVWKDLDYSNFIVCSFMKTSEDSKMITSGYLKKVNLVNPKWVADAKALLQRQTGYN